MTEHEIPVAGTPSPLDAMKLPVRLLLAATLFATNVLAQGVTLHFGGDVYLAVIAGAAATLLGCAPLAVLDDRPFTQVYELLRVPAPVLGLTILAALAVFLPAGWLAGWSARFVAPDPEWLSLFAQSLPRTPGRMVLTFFAVSAAAPLAEEILFRRFLYGGLRRHLGVGASVVLSSLIFAFAHWEPWFFLGLAAVGAVTALVYEATGSLTTAVVVHGVHNAVSLWLMIRQGGLVDAAAPEEMPDPALVLASLAALVVCLTLLFRGRRSG